PPKLVTTTLVAPEGHAWFLRRHDRYRALQFLSLFDLLRPLRLVSVTPKEQAAATEILRRFSDQNLTLTDAVGLHLMHKAGTSSCWSTDHHLGLTGVPLVIHQY
ncbi:MAG: type II toxin-antitoxin system VapC family toxin, partial [Proteobacteria bacterium]|nr:type II toxin-antitoxin system VapC family toxin [Pseudomonadota bacterium]